MSLVLARLQRSDLPEAYKVILATTPSELDQIYRLRYQVYVTEMGLLSDAHPYVRRGRLRDSYDDYSAQLLLLCGSHPVGTIRLTESRHGPLEVGKYRSLDNVPHLANGVVEATRFMVRRAFRRTGAGAILGVAVHRYLVQSESQVFLAAAKQGNLGRYYQNTGMKPVDGQLFRYDLVGDHLYRLLYADLGRPGDLNRMKWAMIAMMAQWSSQVSSQQIFNSVFKRGFTSRVPLGGES